ncbi:PREDICTED: protein NDUFAF4 homolog [Cyphomyrmex costatus]|uniref:Protein NDUFAF4 like protein n=1 Tax=Cyphomyrmex costatus TaxID=456900 RepID=A0A195C4Z7_9HYME|nr:PREDICTED: protein NDUFAF4 homolog [Cyphomyrmex costatus]XP_018403863.1 PREDICTED: protein NDUFAF4 homolog [Cyphomyrmex costatus]XP_018403864.1 PREDICTED: protein NDUFAF4 homolog [Cyphomyrmex costatus]KYM95233.1 Protein NDUFAF4 like protein [Cyphomyrmex costatus]
MGKIYSKMTRPIRTFNIENRAAELISREKPIPAPQYATTEKQKKLLDQVNPHFLEDHYQKNMQLDQRLKDVFVTSRDPQEIKESMRDSKLPQSRQSSENNFVLEFCEPTVIPMGKCSLKQALTFLLQHKRDPITYSSESIASEYKMDKKVIDDILKYFKLYVTASSNNSEPSIQFLDSIEDPIQDMLDTGTKIRKDKKKQK